MASKVWDELIIIHSETWTIGPLKLGREWISNFILHFIMDVITYPCWDISQTISVNGAPDVVDIISLQINASRVWFEIGNWYSMK